MSIIEKQPILILGGFLITNEAYEPMAKILNSKLNRPVYITRTSKLDWIQTVWSYGWIRILDRVDKLVKELQSHSPTGYVTLIGHSSGGIMLRLYLATQAFENKSYKGLDYCNYLITLGSPHIAVKATKLRAMVNKRFPGSYYSNQVKYISVAGEIDLNNPNLTIIAKNSAQRSYKSISGEKVSIGDGLVPSKCALLKGSQQIILKETSHGGFFGKDWYGSESRVEKWWNAIRT